MYSEKMFRGATSSTTNPTRTDLAYWDEKSKNNRLSYFTAFLHKDKLVLEFDVLTVASMTSGSICCPLDFFLLISCLA
jgi:hypothetical protein